MPIYDCVCTKCGCKIEVWLKMDEAIPPCPDCYEEMTKVPGGYFKLKYDNQTQSCGWAKDGYATNHFWDEVKKQRSEGKKVKGVHEN